MWDSNAIAVRFVSTRSTSFCQYYCNIGGTIDFGFDPFVTYLCLLLCSLRKYRQTLSSSLLYHSFHIMHPSLRALNARKPLINFIGKRSWPNSEQPNIFEIICKTYWIRARTRKPTPASCRSLRASEIFQWLSQEIWSFFIYITQQCGWEAKRGERGCQRVLGSTCSVLEAESQEIGR